MGRSSLHDGQQFLVDHHQCSRHLERDNRVTEHIDEVSKLRIFAEQKPLRRVFSFLYVIVGVALGDSWISPEDFVVSKYHVYACKSEPMSWLPCKSPDFFNWIMLQFTWGPLLKDLSRMNSNGLNSANSLAVKIQKQLAEGKYEDATTTWSELEQVVLSNSNNVDIYTSCWIT
ncbi:CARBOXYPEPTIDASE [Salix viminalis]|uniref:CARBOXYPEPTIDASE n=1 Tax=Salix viminalis TaxID=40686 RepID=A0A9Q0V692_SALVM|nr:CARBOXYPEPTIDASE [Salix viminalis]